MNVVDVLDAHSKMIYQEKKTALESGDEMTWRKVGMGKDILSVLREYSIVMMGILLTIDTFSKSKYGGKWKRQASGRGCHRSDEV